MPDELLSASIGAGAAICGGLITGAFEALREWWTRPKLKLDYAAEAARLVESTYVSNGQTIVEIFVRIRIRNLGRRVARDCQVFLVGIKEVHATGTHDTSYQDSMVLTWPGYPRDYSPRQIPKGIETYVDVVSVRKNDAGWRFQVKSLYSSQQALMSFKGTYKLDMLATADNAEPVSLSISVVYEQDWHTLRVLS